jgi:anaerobic selenocysteine-containing dehydrogenase
MDKVVIGKDGGLYLYSKGLRFAVAERFTLQMIEFAADGVTAGKRLYMVVQDITVTDTVSTAELINEMLEGGLPDIAFQGKYKTYDGFAERVIFRDCVTSGSFDVTQLAGGYLESWAFWINATEDETKQLDRA